jgi:hypothetical protein
MIPKQRFFTENDIEDQKVLFLLSKPSVYGCMDLLASAVPP